MPVFIYNARSRAGEKVSGTVDAADRRSALQQVEKMGQIPVSVEEQSAAAVRQTGKKKFLLWYGRREKMGTRDLLLFTTELKDLLASGMTLGNALNCLANRKTGRSEDEIVTSLRDEIVRGASLSDALKLHPTTFSTFYISMIKAGEASGALAEVLERLVEHYERMQELKEKIITAMVYPAFVITIGIGVLIFAMVFVMPKFQAIFEQSKQALPLPTVILISASGFMAKYGILIMAAIAVGILLFSRAVKTQQGKMWWHRIILKVPLVKGIVACGIYANFARTLGTLLANGVPVLQALGIVEKTVGNVVIGGEIHNARDRVTDGTTISGPLAAGKVFPAMMTDMMAIGEQTGDMPGSLNHVAKRYENELNRNIKIFTTALEPIMIVIITFVVGFVAVAILLAVVNMTNGLGA